MKKGPLFMGQNYSEPSPLTGPGDISVLKPIGYPRPESDYRTLTEWVNAVLHEDKLSTDAELIDHIMSGGMSKEKADWIVSQRSEALKNPEYIVRISRRGDPMQKKIGEIRKMIKQSAASNSLEDQVIEFLVDNPSPPDSDVHAFAEEIGVETEEVEAAIYALAGRYVAFLGQGRAQDEGITVEDVDPDELAAGIKVEMEHTDDEDLAEKIALDHLAEAPTTYYTALKQMEESLGIKGAAEEETVIMVDDEFWTGGGLTKEYPNARTYYYRSDALKELEKARRKYPGKKVELVRDYGLASQEVVALRRFEAGADLTMEDVTLLKGIKERVDQMPGMVSTEIRELAEDLSAFLAATPDAATIGGDETVDKMLDNLRSLRRELYKSIEEMWAVLRGMRSVADEILGEGNKKKVTVGDEAGGWNK